MKYISDRFYDKYQELVEEGDGFEEDIDEYTSEGIFFVPAGCNTKNRFERFQKDAHFFSEFERTKENNKYMRIVGWENSTQQ